MMKRIAAAIAASVVAALLMAGCTTDLSSVMSGQAGLTAGPDPINLTDVAAVNALCEDEATEVANYVAKAAAASPESAQRTALSDWGVVDTSDDAALQEIVGALNVRKNADCEATIDTAKEGSTVGVANVDGSVMELPIVESPEMQVVDTTGQSVTPPLLNGSLRFTAQTLSWGGLVDRVGDQQWYKDGINARAAQTGFTWDDVLKFAKVNKMVDGKVAGANALAIQVFNLPDMSDAEARDEVRKYITPSVEETIGITVDRLPIQHHKGGFVNTRQVGDDKSPKMGEYFDMQPMVRVTLMPIKFDKNDKAVGLDGSRGAGIFIDCGNLHWVPVAKWICTDARQCGERPTCPSPSTGNFPNCNWPTPPPPPNQPPSGGCKHDCAPPPGCQHNCNPPDDSKDWSESPQEDGWVPLGPGPLTDGKESQRQKESGQTSGNVIDNKVPEGTKSGDTTPDLPSGTVTAPGATPADGSNGEPPEDTSDDVVDEEVTNQDDGGTQGDTCVTDPFTGENNC